MKGKTGSRDRADHSLSDLAQILGFSDAEVAERKRFLSSIPGSMTPLGGLRLALEAGQQRLGKILQDHLTVLPGTSGPITDGPLRDRLRADLDALLKVVSLDVGLTLGTSLRDREDGRHVTKAEVRGQAETDPLTGLASREWFARHLEATIAASDPDRDRFAVMRVEIEHFRTLVDDLGPVAGDQLLQEVAQLIARQARAVDTVARLGHDQFAVLSPRFLGDEDIVAAAERLRQTLSQPYRLGDSEVYVSCSIGVGLYPQDGTGADLLMRSARTAGAGFQQRLAPRPPLDSQLHGAFHKRELNLAYQPQIDLRSGEIVGLETLMRWHQPEGAPVPPERFISVAEGNGLIVPMGKWALDTALAQAREWNRSTGRPIRVAVNITARQLHHRDFIADLRQSLESSSLPPRLLELEITEDLVARDPQKVLDLLRVLKGIGVRLALDDFGTGNSSLSSLKALPLDVLKIDRSIIRGLGMRGKDDAITSAIVDLGRGLGLGLIAEGVETLEQEAFLKTIGCPEAQGYRFCRPVPASAVTGLLLSPRRPPG